MIKHWACCAALLALLPLTGCSPSEPPPPTNDEFKIPDIEPSGSGVGGQGGTKAAGVGGKASPSQKPYGKQ